MATYQDLLETVSQRAGLNSGEARAAAEATVTALARTLRDTDRQRLAAAVPAELRDDFPLEAPLGATPPVDQASFVRTVALLSNRPAEQARMRAEAVLTALAELDPELMDSLQMPADVRELVGTPPPGGGLGVAALTPQEVRAALADLPHWSGDQHELRREITLPQANLDRVLAQLERVRQELGRRPEIHRDAGTATLVARTRSIGAVTRDDVALAHRVDTAIDEAGAGIA